MRFPFLIVSLWLLAAPMALAQPPTLPATGTDAAWSTAFSYDWIDDSVNDVLVVGDDVYIVGDFDDLMGIPEADHIARWDGTDWHALGDGLSSQGWALYAWNGDVYVGGGFDGAGGVAGTKGLARWDGTQWHAVGGGVDGSALAFAADGDDLYVAGRFNDAGGDTSIRSLARWDGTAWHRVGTGGIAGTVFALTFYDGDLYIGGELGGVAGVWDTHGLARWDGRRWSSVGGGTRRTEWVWDFEVYADTLYVGGTFLTVGGVENTDGLARWDGTQWHSAPFAIDSSFGVHDLVTTAEELYVVGSFDVVGTSAHDVVRWNGRTVTAAAPGTMPLYLRTLAPYGNGFLLGGAFEDLTEVGYSRGLVRYDGTAWRSLAGKVEGLGLGGRSDHVSSFAPSGNGMYIAGYFENGGGDVQADGVAHFTGGRLKAVSGPSATQRSHKFVAYLMGRPLVHDGVSMWRRQGSAWEVLGGSQGAVFTLAGLNGWVYAGGLMPTHTIQWAGQSSQSMNGGTDGPVYAMASGQTGVFVGGDFTAARDLPGTRYLAWWNGGDWEALGPQLNGAVHALAARGDDEVYVGGMFTEAEGTSGLNHVARWDGTAWSALGDGLPGTVLALAMARGYLYAGGDFEGGIARWDPYEEVWERLGSGLDGPVHAIRVEDDVVYIGGRFSGVTDGVESSRIAVYTDPDLKRVDLGMERASIEITGANPADVRTEFVVVLANAQYASVEVVDVLGRRVASLWDGLMEDGRPYVLGWETSGVASGLYVVRVKAASVEVTTPIVVAR